MRDGFLFKSFQYSITFGIILNPSPSSYNIAAFAQQTQRYHTITGKLIQAREKKDSSLPNRGFHHFLGRELVLATIT